jgi:hypothetical protein
VSIKALSNELNIPITETQSNISNEMKKIKVDTSDFEKNMGFDANNIEKIDKPVKTSGLRVRNLKKSMLNDNRLQKLRQKFLKRSKSTVESDNSLNGSVINEEFQNKENECPQKMMPVIEAHPMPEESPQTHSMNRNKVKMGTRVFSSQFLNKSFDNLYNTPSRNNSFQNLHNYSFNGIDLDEFDHKNLVETSVDDALSMKSSMMSVYFTEKPEERTTAVDQTPKACVIRE